MNVPKTISDEMASIEAEIATIEEDASRRIAALRERLNIFSFVIGAFAGEESPPALTIDAPLKDRIFAILRTQGPMRAAQIRETLGANDHDYHAVGAAIGALSRLKRIKLVGNEWATATGHAPL